MFERNRVDSAKPMIGIPVEIEYQSGASEPGKLNLPRGRTVMDALNGDGLFVEFEPYGGAPGYLSKSHIASIKPMHETQRPALVADRREADFDPHTILGVAPGCSWDDVRQAYLLLSKTYHPDRYAGVALPAEVKTYLDSMVRHINAAYGVLEKANSATRSAPQPSQPVYTTGQRR